ncbi:hypothetical protein TYRP_000015 [Tyrophagus putrescentiae]|nr:hypothetical protein TYRP_000015 [Tyrophagus putrescentiae]
MYSKMGVEKRSSSVGGVVDQEDQQNSPWQVNPTGSEERATFAGKWPVQRCSSLHYSSLGWGRGGRQAQSRSRCLSICLFGSG